MLWASAIVEIQDADGVVTLPLRRGLLVRGRLHFDGPDPPSAALLPQFSAFMLPPPAEMGHMVPPRVHVQTDGTFALELPGGEYLARLTNGDNIGILFDASTPRPSDAEIQALHAWRVRSAVANGRDIIDAPLLLSAEVTEVVVTLERGNTALYGRVRAGLNLPQDYRLVLIPADRALWAYSGNGRRFVAAPVSSDGRFSVPAPPGDYLIGAVRELPTNWRNGDVIAQLATAMSAVHLPDGGAILQLEPPTIEMRSVTRHTPAAAITRDRTRDVLRPRAVPDLPLPAPAGVTVTGQVVSDEDGRPLADVRISQHPSGVPDVFTDSAGRFILRVEPGRRTIYAWKSAWSTFNAHGEGPSLMVAGDVDG